jgi:hypothetical protein
VYRLALVSVVLSSVTLLLLFGFIVAATVWSQGTVRVLEKDLANTRFQARFASAYAVELYAIMKAAGLDPPPPPEEMQHGDPARSTEGNPER